MTGAADLALRRRRALQRRDDVMRVLLLRVEHARDEVPQALVEPRQRVLVLLEAVVLALLERAQHGLPAEGARASRHRLREDAPRARRPRRHAAHLLDGAANALDARLVRRPTVLEIATQRRPVLDRRERLVVALDSPPAPSRPRHLLASREWNQRYGGVRLAKAFLQRN